MNYYTKNRKFYLEQVDLEPVTRDLEGNFEGKDAYTLHSFDEAWQWYNMALENAGDICANFIEPRAEEVDQKGARFDNGVVHWADRTKENMKTLAKAGYTGGTLERKYGGLNLPVTVNTVIVEMVSQADASLMNLFGLQDIAVTVSKFGSEEQKDRVLPKFAKGEVSGSMALTEPDAGSDLPAVMCKAIEKDGKWYLDGVKRFITNGCGDVSLVLARTEEGTKDARGLSMMLYERYRDGNMIVRRIEEKMGIHGSPTCELQFNMAECELVGKRKFGLIKYVMSLMNGARLGISAQALGIAQAALNEAIKYANEREQFKQKIVNFPAVYQMLKKSEVEVETARQLLYNTAYYVDLQEMYERQSERGEDVRKLKQAASAMANFLTPLSKFVSTEMANKVCYDAVQIHGGCGFMQDFPVSRLARDARITNIYEGTSQLQVVAAMASINSKIFDRVMEEYNSLEISHLKEAQKQILVLMELCQQSIEKAKSLNSKEFLDYVGNYLVEMVSIAYRLMLFIKVADKHEEKRDLFNFYLAESEVRMHYLANTVDKLMKTYGDKIDVLKHDFEK